ncbi:MAG: 7-carboxy-7-deazaguanine synthase QueE [Opitutales bacterium]
MLPIHEQFYSFQGEGIHAGRAAYFIRTFGCPVHCPWCDSAGTWHPDYTPDRIKRFEAGPLAEAAAATQAEFVVVTGGEPTIHNLAPLTEALHERGLQVHLETSGAFPIQGDFDWVTLSPKRWKRPLEASLERADELKIIVDSTDSIEEYTGFFKPAGRPVWLHPEWSKCEDREILDAITEWVKAKGSPYRAGWQMHKPYQADALDPKSVQAAPLGGDPTRAYKSG